MIIHVVQQGETIYSIAASYGLGLERLIIDNNMSNPFNLAIGQTIVILYPEKSYTVEEGDTLQGIADANGVTVMQLLRNNPQLSDREFIYPGEIIIINYDVEKIRNISVNGYSYPFIDKMLLKKTLPFLTYLTIFTYVFTPEGELLSIDDEEVIQIAKEYGVAPIMLLSTVTSEGAVNSELAHAILIDEESQNRLINNIITNMRVKGYYSLTIDFQFILTEDRQAFVDFVAKVTNYLNQEGYGVLVSITPLTPLGVFEGHDYAGLGNAANKTILLRYEWGFTYMPPMPVAPMNEIRKLLDYTVMQIPSEKISIGVQKFGYDWTLPFVLGVSRANSLGNESAVELAADVNATIYFDEVAQTAFFTYAENINGELIQHIVWFDDARSVDSKVKLVPEYQLEGVCVWNIMRYFAQMWLVINAQYEIDKVVL